MKYVVAGINTDAGKTVVSAILVQMLSADYWKPIQAGQIDQTDRMAVQALIDEKNSKCHPEAYIFKHALSPHHAARLDNARIDAQHITDMMPALSKALIIEMAGGLLSPLNDTLTQCDLYSAWNCQWVLVANHYLGSINHTLLTIEVMRQKKLPLLGIIFNAHSPSVDAAKPSADARHAESESFILNYTGVRCLGKLRTERELTPTTIWHYGKLWKSNF